LGDLIPYEAEGPESEWKERLPRPERVAKTLVAFANGCGGSLWIGVRDSGEAVGVSDPRLVELALRIVAEELVRPLPELEFRRHVVRGHTLVELRVTKGGARPYGMLTAEGDLRVYVRDGSSTRPAASHTVRALARAQHEEPSPVASRLDPRALRLLRILAERREPTLSELARIARMGRRSARRLVVPLLRSGLVGENERHRLWLTPLGHRSA